MLGCLRAIAQFLSYELAMGFGLLCVFMAAGSANLTTIVLAQQPMFFIIPLFPVAMVFLSIMLAETNRPPFDMPEAESELVAGYHVEYASIAFSMFFLAEYSNMLLMSAF